MFLLFNRKTEKRVVLHICNFITIRQKCEIFECFLGVRSYIVKCSEKIWPVRKKLPYKKWAHFCSDFFVILAKAAKQRPFFSRIEAIFDASRNTLQQYLKSSRIVKFHIYFYWICKLYSNKYLLRTEMYHQQFRYPVHLDLSIECLAIDPIDFY